MVGDLHKLHDKISGYENSIQPSIDNYVQDQIFDDKHGFKHFYQWSLKTHPFELESLLAGEEVTLYADIAGAEFDAVKFKTIFLKIETTNQSTNARLNEELGQFYVELEHSGVSFYKFNKEEYRLESGSTLSNAEKLLLRYQYGCTTTCDNSNVSFKKLAKTEPLLSPYTFWKMRLVPVLPRQDAFKKIESIYKAEENLLVSLGGEGRYVITERLVFNTTSLDAFDVYGKAKRVSDKSYLSL